MLKFFVDNWKFSVLLTVLTVLMGLLGLGLLQRETFPPVNFATLTVVTIYPGASPDEVHDRVTRVIEDELRGTSGLKDVKSVSQTSRSQITIRIDIDRDDVEEIVNEVQRAVSRAASQLPAEVLDAPLVTELKADEIPIVELAIMGSNEGRARDRSAEILREILEDVPGVASVRLSGYQERELQVLLDRQKLMATGTGITEVVNSLRARLTNTPAGSLESESSTALVRLIGRSSDPRELERVVIRSNDSGVSTRVGQLGRVVDGGKRQDVLVRVNGEPATLLVVTKKSESDAISVVDEAMARIEAFRPRLAKDQSILIYNDEGTRVKDRLSIVQFNAIAGLAAVLFVLFFFLPGKIGVFSAASLPICALGTIATMVYMDANFNIITMIALVICLGNLVDNSVVVSEHYGSLREQGKPARDAAIESARQFWIPFTASTVTIISAFLPMLVTQGVLGQFIRWIPIVVTIALVLSLLESLTLLPARLRFIDPKPRTNAEGGSRFQDFEAAFGRFVAATLRRKYLTVGALSGLIVSGFFVTALFNRFELFPADGVEYYIARFEAPPQTALKKTDAAAGELSQAVAQALGPDIVESVIARSGIQQVELGDPQSKNGDHVGFLLIRIKKDVYINLNIEETLARLREIPKPETFRRLTFETMAGGPPVGQAVTVTFRSSEYEDLGREAREFATALGRIDGVLNVETDEVETGSEFIFLPNDERIAFVGLSAEQIGLNLRAAIEGIPVAKLTQYGLEYDVVVRSSAADKSDFSDINESAVINPRGNLTPVRLLGEFKSSKAPPTVKSYDFRRSITVTADVNPNVITSTGANAKAREILESSLKDASNVSTVFGGEDESTKESLQSLGIALILAIFGIFATLVFTFASFSRPVVILSTIPLGLVGVFYSFALNQRPLSFLAFIGVVGLSGVVINSAIILVDFIEELRRDRPDTPNAEILIEASRKRLRAVMATGLTTVVGLLPTAFGLGGDDPLLIPITLALSWGMIVGTILSLVWIPSFYLILDELGDFTKRGLRRLSSRLYSRATPRSP